VRVRRARLRLGENPALAGIKHCNRLEQVLARREWSDPGIGEALMFSSSGALVSGTMSNVFLVHGSKLLTPSVDRCGVAGVMRATVLDLAAQLGIPAQERRLDETELAAAEELFLTNALIGIRPISELDGVSVPPGPVTRRLQRELMPYLAVARATGHTGV
jgi:4-amino-4-deoxychorismate lyase